MMRIVRGLMSLIAIVVVLVGVPWLLLAVGSIPPVDQWLRVVRAPDDGSVLIGLMTIVGWLAWAVMASALIIELLSVLTRQRLRVHLPGFGWLQAMSAVLVVGALGLFIAPVSDAPAAVTPRSAPSDFGAQDVSPAELAEQGTAGATRHVAPTMNHVQPAIGSTGSNALEGAPVADDQQQVGGARHAVQLGDDLWSLAEHYYGDGSKWRRIAAANPTLLTGGPDVLEPGWNLVIPTDPATTTSSAGITVRPGDTLSGLAEEHLGDEDQWPELWSANRAVLADPHQLDAGMQLQLPENSGSVETPSDDVAEGGPDHGQPDRQDPIDEQRAPETGPTDEGHTPSNTGPEEDATTGDPDEDAPTPVTAVVSTDGSPSSALVGGVGALLAAGLVGSFGARRVLQLHERPVGRRIARPELPEQRLSAALAHTQDVTGVRLLRQAEQLVALHCQQTGIAPPVLDYALVDDRRVELRLIDAGAPPAGFSGDQGRWILDPAAVVTGPVGDLATPPWPALVGVGRLSDGPGEVLVDLERLRDLGIDLDDPQHARDLTRGLIAELLTGSQEVRVQAVGIGRELIESADATDVEYRDDIELLLAELEDRAAHHHLDDAAGTPQLIRRDPARTEAWRPTIVVLDADLSTQQRRRLRGLIDDDRTPLAVVRVMAPGKFNLTGGRHGAHLDAIAVDLVPQQLGEPQHASIVRLFDVSGSLSTAPAPWWTAGPPGPSGLTPSPQPPVGGTTLPSVVPTGTKELPMPAPTRAFAPGREAPMVGLLGTITLEGAAGTEPSRARKQCIEYCAWLLENPDANSRDMAAQLFVAEPTRRSNMSRLRTWLGHDEQGQPYLPEAYTGRINLHEAVTSDWQLLRQLIPGDIRAAQDDTLVAALELVRGAPLADAAPQQWGWAEELRLDMTSMIRDIAFVLAGRCHSVGNIDLLRWTVARGLSAAPDDEVLLALWLRAEHQVGNASQVQRLARRITNRTRVLGVDLLDETVDLLQEVAEGQVRARRAF